MTELQSVIQFAKGTVTPPDPTPVPNPSINGGTGTHALTGITTGDSSMLFIFLFAGIALLLGALLVYCLKGRVANYGGGNFVTGGRRTPVALKIFVAFLISVLVFTTVVLSTGNVFADTKESKNLNVAITQSAKMDFNDEGKMQPVELTITNKEAQPVNLTAVSMKNIKENEATWKVAIQNDEDCTVYDNVGDGTLESISFIVPANSTKKVIVNCDISTEELNKLNGEKVAELNFEARPTNFNADFYCAGEVGDHAQMTPARINFNFDLGMFQRTDNTKFDKDVAKFSACMATVAKSAEDSVNPEMQGCNVIVDGYDYNRKDPTGFAKALGFDNTYYYDMANPGNEMAGDLKTAVEKPVISKDYYPDDLLAYWLAHKKVNIEGKESEVILLGIQGTNGSLEEWTSDLDFGANTKEYYKAVGEDKEGLWSNKQDHKGLNVAANRAMISINSYIKGNTDTSEDVDKYIIISGHSRGGGTTNLIGPKFEDKMKADGTHEYKDFAYAYASPNTTRDPSHANYKTVFNICNTDDSVAIVPPDESNYYRYGTDIKRSVRDSEELTAAFKKNSTLDEYNAPTQEALDEMIQACCKILDDGTGTYPRENMYKLDKGDGRVAEYWTTYDSKAEAEKDLKELKPILKKLRLDRFCTVELKEEPSPGSWRIIRTICPGFVMQYAADVITDPLGTISEYIPVVEGKYAKLISSFAGCFVAMRNPHSLASYYSIVDQGIE